MEPYSCCRLRARDAHDRSLNAVDESITAARVNCTRGTGKQTHRLYSTILATFATSFPPPFTISPDGLKLCQPDAAEAPEMRGRGPRSRSSTQVIRASDPQARNEY